MHSKFGAGNPFNEEMFEALWVKVDKNGDGKISLHELTTSITNGAEKRGWLSD